MLPQLTNWELRPAPHVLVWKERLIVASKSFNEVDILPEANSLSSTSLKFCFGNCRAPLLLLSC